MSKFKAKDHKQWAEKMIATFKLSNAEWRTHYGMVAEFDHDKKQLTILEKGMMPPGEVKQHKAVFKLVGYKVVVADQKKFDLAFVDTKNEKEFGGIVDKFRKDGCEVVVIDDTPKVRVALVRNN